MKFRYIGEYPAGRSSLVCWGHEFAPGIAVDLPEPFASKAARNRFFEADNGVAPVVPIVTSIEDMDKPALIALADERGVKIDKRWSEDRIRGALGSV